MPSYIKVNPNPKKATRINTDRSRIVNLVRESNYHLNYMQVIRMAQNELLLTLKQAKNLVGKCLHPDAGYLKRVEID